MNDNPLMKMVVNNNQLMNYDPTHDVQLGQKVMAELPSTPWEIAKTLHHEKVKAVCGEPTRCAIADYLTARVPLPDGFTWSVGYSGTGISPQDAPGLSGAEDAQRYVMDMNNRQEWKRTYRETNIVPHTEAVTDFINRFDEGQFPGLVADGQ